MIAMHYTAANLARESLPVAFTGETVVFQTEAGCTYKIHERHLYAWTDDSNRRESEPWENTKTWHIVDRTAEVATLEGRHVVAVFTMKSTLITSIHGIDGCALINHPFGTAGAVGVLVLPSTAPGVQVPIHDDLAGIVLKKPVHEIVDWATSWAGMAYTCGLWTPVAP